MTNDRSGTIDSEASASSPDISQSFLDSLTDNTAILNRNGTIVAVNESWKTFARENGLKDDPGMIGVNYFEVAEGTNDALASESVEGLEKVLNGDIEEFKLDYPCHSPDEKHWFRLRAARFKHNDTIYLTVAHTDVTERKLRERKLSIRTKRQELAQKIASLGHWRISFPDETVHWSDEVDRILDFDPEGNEEVRYDDILDYYHENDRKRVMDNLENAIESGQPVNFRARVVRPDGEIRHVECYGKPRYRESGELDDIFGVLQDITERTELERELAEQNERLELAQQLANLGHWSISLPDRDVFWSDETYRIHGLDPSDPEPSLQKALELYVEEDRKRVRKKLEQAIESKTKVLVEARIQRPDGVIRHVKSYGRPQRDDSGSVTGFFGIYQDVTDQKETELALRKSEKRFRQLAENISEVFWITPADKSDMIYVSPAYEDVWGRSTESLYNRPDSFVEAIHPDDRNKVNDALEKQKQGDYDVEYRVQQPDGEIRWVRDRAFPIKDNNGDVYRIVGIAEDITELKTLERERKKFVELVEHSPNFIGRANLDGELTYINRAGKTLVGVDDEDNILGKTLETLHPESDHDRLQETLKSVLTEGSWSSERQFQNQSTGDITEALLNAFVINDPDTGEPLELAAIATDISEQIIIEEQLRKMVKEKETLLQEIHHRVKNNLQVVLGLLGLQSRELDNKDAQNALKNSKQRIQSMAMIHQKLYEGTRLSKLDFEAYVEDLVDHIQHTQDDGQLQSVKTDIQPADLDPDTVIPVGLIINELVTNSIKHGLKGTENGQLTIRFRLDESMNYRLVIRDNGRGADPNKLRESDSLGMQLIRNLTENQLHGEIEFTNNSGLRAEVTFPPYAARYDHHQRREEISPKEDPTD